MVNLIRIAISLLFIVWYILPTFEGVREELLSTIADVLVLLVIMTILLAIGDTPIAILFLVISCVYYIIG